MLTRSAAKVSTQVVSRLRKIPFSSIVFKNLDAEHQDMLQVLKNTNIFSELDEAELMDLLTLLHQRTFSSGEQIFAEGEPGLGLYIVFRGEVEIGRLDKDGKGRLARLSPGDVFGEVSFLDGSGRSAPATACCHCELIGFYRTELLELMERKPALASKILFCIAKQLGMRLRATLQLIPT